MELCATATVFTVRILITYDSLECTVGSEMGSENFYIYIEVWNGTAYVFTVSSVRVCDSCEYTMRCGMCRDSYNI